LVNSPKLIISKKDAIKIPGLDFALSLGVALLLRKNHARSTCAKLFYKQ
jgi:hypothetical protein